MMPGRKPGIPNGSRTEEVFAFINAEIARCGRFPSHSAIMDHMGWLSSSSVNDTLQRLCIQKRIKRADVSPISAVKRRFEYEIVRT